MYARVAFIALGLLLTRTGAARATADDPSRIVASSAAAELEKRYVFPTRAKTAGALVRDHAASGAYDGKTKDALAAALTMDLAGVLHDKHVRVSYSNDIEPTASASGDAPSPAELAQQAAFERSVGFGVQRTAHLTGNVGYIDLRMFAETKPDRDRVIDGLADSAAYSDAVILDLRQNHGGDPDAVARLLSHFFPARTHLNDFVGRGDDNAKIENSTFTGKVRGPQITAPLYVLTSRRTFSGGEECAYDVQALKRGTLVGEPTGGGANPGSSHRLSDHFDIFVPDARARNPITMTNWEGTGVMPDVAVPADRALVTAYGMALDELLKDPKLESDDRDELKHTREGLATSDDAALLTEPSDHVNSATSAATEDRTITARVNEIVREFQSGEIDRTKLSAAFSTFLTPQNVDFGKSALGPGGPATLVYRGSSETPAGKTYLYDARFASAPTLHLTFVFDGADKVASFEFEQ